MKKEVVGHDYSVPFQFLKCLIFKEGNESILLDGVGIGWSGFMTFEDQSKAHN